MQVKEIEKINADAKDKSTHGGLIEAAARFLGVDEKIIVDSHGHIPQGYEGSVGSIIDEIRQWNDADDKTRRGILAFGNLKDIAVRAGAAVLLKPPKRKKAKKPAVKKR